MPKPRNPDAKPLTLGGERAVNFTIRLPISLALEIEDHLHAEMRRNLVETGSRAEASVASLFRAAIEHYMACPDAEFVKKPRRGRPPKVAAESVEEPKSRRGRPPKSDSDQPKKAKPKRGRPPAKPTSSKPRVLNPRKSKAD